MNLLYGHFLEKFVFFPVYIIGLLKRGQVIAATFNVFNSQFMKGVSIGVALCLGWKYGVALFLLYKVLYIIINLTFDNKYKPLFSTLEDIDIAEEVSDSVVEWADITAHIVSERIDKLAIEGKL